MNYKLYQQSRDAAWTLLRDLKIRELPVQVSDICQELGIPLKLYIPPDDNDGFCQMRCGLPYIFISSQVSPVRQRFTAAHELGHIILGHIGKYELVNREPSATDNPIEQAANVFASRLLAPACVLWGLNITSADQIAKVCKISMPAAKFRMERMKELYQRDKFLTSSLEREVYEQFEDFIKKNRF